MKRRIISPKKEGGPGICEPGEYEKEKYLCKKAFALFAYYYTGNL